MIRTARAIALRVYDGMAAVGAFLLEPITRPLAEALDGMAKHNDRVARLEGAAVDDETVDALIDLAVCGVTPGQVRVIAALMVRGHIPEETR